MDYLGARQREARADLIQTVANGATYIGAICWACDLTAIGIVLHLVGLPVGVAPGPADRGIPASEGDCDAGPGAGPPHPRVLKGSAVVGGQRVTWAMSDGPCAAVVVNGRPAEHAQAAALLMKALDLDPAALPERHKRRVMLDIEDADGGRWLDDGIRELHKLRRDADEAAAALDSVRTEIDVTRYASEELDASDIVCQLDRIMATLEAMRGDG